MAAPVQIDRADHLTGAEGKPLNILTLCHEWPPVGGGAAAVTEALCRAYVSLGHRVTVLTMAMGRTGTILDEPNLSVMAVPCGRKRREMASPAEGLRWAWAGLSAARSRHRADPFDACHAHFIMPSGIIADRLKRTEGLPFIITPHGSDVPGYNAERLKLIHRLIRPWWRRICLNADRIVSPSEDLMALLKASAPNAHGSVIPNGIDPGRFVPGDKARRILLCSRLVGRKGFHHVLEILARRPFEGWEVDIVGDGPMRPRLEELAAGSRTPVRFHGWIGQDDPLLKRLYAEATLFILPSQRENFSIALLEAMSAGCAIITTDVSGNPEAVGDCARLVPWDDRDRLAEEMMALSADPAGCVELGRRARERVREMFTWTMLARRYIETLREVMAERVGIDS